MRFWLEFHGYSPSSLRYGSQNKMCCSVCGLDTAHEARPLLFHRFIFLFFYFALLLFSPRCLWHSLWRILLKTCSWVGSVMYMLKERSAFDFYSDRTWMRYSGCGASWGGRGRGNVSNTSRHSDLCLKYWLYQGERNCQCQQDHSANEIPRREQHKQIYDFWCQEKVFSFYLLCLYQDNSAGLVNSAFIIVIQCFVRKQIRNYLKILNKHSQVILLEDDRYFLNTLYLHHSNFGMPRLTLCP